MTSTKQVINKINAATYKEELQSIYDWATEWVDNQCSLENQDFVSDCLAECFTRFNCDDDERSLEISQRYQTRIYELGDMIDLYYDARWEQVDWMPEEEEEEEE